MTQPETQVNFSDVAMPSRKGRLETYLWDYGDEVSLAIAEDFYDATHPIQPYGVLIPVAAHQETDRIGPALAQYAAQDGAEPFTIFLLLNYPSREADKAEASIAAVKKAQQTYPNLDIRCSASSYDTFTIGQIRKDLWDGAMRAALADGIYEQAGREMIGINHDIDTESIRPHYIRNIQRHYQALQQQLERDEMSEEPLPSRFTQVKHAYPFETHPNIARAILWTDIMYRQVGRNGNYEEGLVIPLSLYAKQGGFKAEDSTHETRDMAANRYQGIPCTSMETSPRRYIARLGEHGIRGIWTDESFTSTDDCRDAEKLPGDITQRQLEDIVLESVDDAIRMFGNAVPRQRWRKIMDELSLSAVSASTPNEYIGNLDLQGDIARELTPRFRIARRILESVIGVPDVAQLIDEQLMAEQVRDFEQAMKQVLREELLIITRD